MLTFSRYWYGAVLIEKQIENAAKDPDAKEQNVEKHSVRYSTMRACG
jgi:hypothetical protein